MMSENQIPNPKIDVERVNEIKKASFWVSQFFILLATVVGVYLAATQGYKQAVQFENMTSYKESYYLQKSLQYELQDNVAILKKYMAKIQDGAYYAARNEPLDFYNLVWENMKFSSTTLSTPPELLRQAQQFYREVDNLHERIAKSNLSVGVGAQKLQEQIDIVEQNLIPALEKSTEQIRKELSGTDIIL